MFSRFMQTKHTMILALLLLSTVVSSTQCLDGMKFRLADGDNLYHGRVEVFRTSIEAWTTVCDDHFGKTEAKVLCRSLGYSGGTVAYYGEGHLLKSMANVTCQGGEYSLEQCKYDSWPFCSFENSVGVDCVLSILQVRLVNGSSEYSGRVEIFYNHTWGTICGIATSDDAVVICRSLGYSGGDAGGQNAGSGPIWITDVDCTGNEYSLPMCSFNGWGKTGCSHELDMAVNCQPPQGCKECVHMQSCNSATGFCTCRMGWTGKYCDKEINECLSREKYFCPQNSTCINTNGSYYCQHIKAETVQLVVILMGSVLGAVILILGLALIILLCERICRKNTCPYEKISKTLPDDNASVSRMADNNQECNRSGVESSDAVNASKGYGSCSQTNMKRLI